MKTVFKDRYEVERQLGKGGFGTVYLARDIVLRSRPVVVKLLREDAWDDPWAAKKFRQEMEALALIDHPGVVGVIDNGFTEDGRQFLVMQYVDGVTLREVLTAKPMDFVRASNILRLSANALGAAHGAGVAHRDLKPENIMLQTLAEGERVKLIDFGLATVRDSLFGSDSSVRKIAGSYAYMAPEQMQGHPEIRSDIYSLGVVAFELLTGSRPFSAQGLAPAIYERAEGLKHRPRELNPMIPLTADEVIVRALATNPEDRPQSAVEFGADLARALTGSPVTLSVPAVAEPDPTPAPPAGPVVTAPAESVLSTCCVLACCAVPPQPEAAATIESALRAVHEFRSAESNGKTRLWRTPSGIVLLLDAPLLAAAECLSALTTAIPEKLGVSMCLHRGPVDSSADLETNAAIPCGGIDLAIRIVESGKPGQVLVSEETARELKKVQQWEPRLRDLGERNLRFGVKTGVFELVRPGGRSRVRYLVLVAVLIVMLLTLFVFILREYS